ncbi:unnamed protein product [Urochloa decumbens]|uniref:Uncharacterized protein n=1 Tax=Urochloa decumbens TaxID=240449 RepID=A0ABC9H2P5_9POAL
MTPFFKSNTTKFRKLPLEDLPQEEDPIDAFCSVFRIVGELGFVSAIFAGVCFQRSGLIHQTSAAVDVANIALLLVGAAGFGASIGCLYDDFFLTPRYIYLRPPSSRRRGRRHRAQT